MQAVALYWYAHARVTKQVGGAGITNIYRVLHWLSNMTLFQIWGIYQYGAVPFNYADGTIVGL